MLLRLLTATAILIVLSASIMADAEEPTPSATFTASSLGILHVHVVGLRNSSGQVVCSLWNGPHGYPENGTTAIKDLKVPIKDNEARCEFTGLPAGRYALVTFHDENGDGKFNQNVLGL